MMFFIKKRNIDGVSVETRMVMTFIFALAHKLGVSPRSLAKVAADQKIVDKYLADFTEAFLNSKIEKLAKKK